MTNFKRVAILAILFLILLVLYYFFETPAGSRKKREPERLVPEFARQEVVLIRVKSPEKSMVTLNRTGDNWKVTSDNKTFAADTVPVYKLLDTVNNIRAETVVSKNPEKFEAFEVTEGKGIEVTIESNLKKPLACFYVGKSGPDIFSTYVRSAKQDRVVLTTGILKTVFEQDINQWRDKAIFKLNKDDIIEYRVEGNVKLHLKKDLKNNWQVLAPESFQAKNETIGNTTENFSKLKAVGFPEGDLKEFQLDKPGRTITAVMKDGSKQVLFVGKQKNAFQCFVKAKDRDTVYLIENYLLEMLSPVSAPDRARPN